MSTGRFIERQRALLQDLRELAARRVTAEETLAREIATLDTRINETYERDRQQAEQDLADARTTGQAEYQAALDQLEQTLGAERRALEAKQRGEIDRITRKAAKNETLARRRLDEAVWASETVYEANEDEPAQRLRTLADVLEERRRELEEVQVKARARVAQYRVRLPDVVPALPAPALPAPASASADEADPGDVAAYRRVVDEQLHAAQEGLVRLQRLRLPRMFKGYVIHLLGVIAIAAAGLVAAGARGWTLDRWVGTTLGVAVVATLAAGFALRLLSRRRVTAAFAGVQEAADAATRASDACLVAGEAERVAREAELRRKRDEEVETARSTYEPIIARIAERRTHHLERIEDTYPRRLEELTERESRERASIEQAWAVRRVEIEDAGRNTAAAVATTRETALAARRETRERAWNALVREWREGMERCRHAIASITDENATLFPAWDDASWKSWRPPRHFAPSIRFGTLAVDRSEIPGGIPEDPELAVDLPARFTLPATLDFPDHGSLLLLSDADGRAAAVDTLQTVMLRLLTLLPPGKVRFTIVDPVGLGETFAGFMHLGDYDDAFVGGRIWTETRHIEQRLADLTEHMETVIQKYLRNEFETIDAYNEEAGEIAEPYRFLVISDFPAGFSETAARRLASIVSSGARCGVHTLVSVDRRQPRPKGLQLEDLVALSTTLEHRDGRFRWRDDVFGDVPLTLDAAAPESFLTRTLHIVGEAAKDATRVEVPFEVIAPDPEGVWTRRCDEELTVPLGRSGATKLQELAIGRGTSQHALIAGKTGSGKSTLLHVLVTNLALWYSPDEVEFYLVDFKKGVEFKTYATHRLPHARAIAIESDREFGLSVLERIDQEMKQRGDRFRELGVQDLAGFRSRVPDEPMPRILLIVDEFQELFVEDDKIGQDAALLMDRLVRQGRAFGIHLLLGSQTLGGAYTLARSTMGQMQVRVALQCSEADSYLIMSDDNAAARLLSRPGEAIYNDAGGRLEGNSPFQICWLPERDRDEQLARIAERARDAGWRRSEPIIVFEGNQPADLAKNHRLTAALRGEWEGPPQAWLGEAIAIKGPTSAAFRRESGANLLIVGQRDEAALATIGSAAIGLAAQYPPRPN
ncbi:MAG: cell division protein FtsK, partial [Phycisphaerae bacterium]|nr:cell division protein FtsK [Phycisphaerae bacterium]